jgi:hypothetical protein
MVNDDFPDDLLEDVKHSYTYFVEKSIYYLKMRDTTNNTSNTNENEESSDNEELSANERSEEEESSDNEELSANERSEEELSDNDEEELSASEEELIEEEPVISTSNNKYKIKPQSQLQSNTYTINKKVKKNTQSKGVDNIEQLPLDWFTKVRQTQKQHNIIPRKSDGKK